MRTGQHLKSENTQNETIC